MRRPPPRPVRRWRRLAVVVAVAAAVAIALAGCGVPTAGGPSAIPRSQVPPQLLSKHPPPTSTPPPRCPVLFYTYFVNAGSELLQATPRCMPSPGSLRNVLVTLLKGPFPNEQATSELVSYLDPSVQVLGTSVTNTLAGGTVATVDFSHDFEQISGPQQVLAVAQVVFTVAYAPLYKTSPTSVGVTFEVEGSPIEVPIATGVAVTGPVHVAQYEALAPP